MTFLGFFNPLIGGPVVIKLELELSVFVGGYLVLEALIWGSPVIKISELL
jgi:hypothetical protein